MADLALVFKGKDEGASKVIRDIKGEASGLGKVMGDVGKVAAGFFAANVLQGAGQKVMDFVGGAISQASELEQSVGGVESVFKESSDKIFDFGKKAADSVGLSKNAFNQLATQTGAFLKNYGYDADQAGEKTIDLTKRAADMAAMFGGSVQDAMSAIQAGLRGQADPLEKYGVSLTAARVEAHALAMTGKETTKTLTDQEKMAAKLDLIFRQTADSAGQFAREEDTAEGAAQRLRAAQSNLAASIGEKLLPIQLKWTQLQMQAVTVLLEQVLPAVDTFISYIQAVVRDGDTLNDFLEQLPGPLQGFAKAVGEVVAFVRDNWSTVSDIFSFVADYVKTRIEGMVQVVRGVIDLVTHVVNGVDDLVHGRWKSAWENFSQIPGDMAEIAVGYVKAQLGNLPQVILSAVGKAGEAASELGSSVAKGLGNAVIDGLNWVIRQVNSFLGTISSLRINIPEKDLGPFGKLGGGSIGLSLNVGSIGELSRLADGGIVTGPMLALLGDNPSRTEAVVPLERAAEFGFGGGQGAIHVHIHMENSHIYGMQDFDRKVDQAMQAAFSRGAFRGTIRTVPQLR